MNCFQIIKSVLDEEYNQIPGDEVEKDKQIQAKLKQLRDNYGQLSKKNQISYNDRITRFASCQKY